MLGQTNTMAAVGGGPFGEAVRRVLQREEERRRQQMSQQMQGGPTAPNPLVTRWLTEAGRTPTRGF